MARQEISPGVFTEEVDQTFRPSAGTVTSAAFVGATEKGPAFTPVTVGSQTEYRKTFGGNGYYTDFAASRYLDNADAATIVRVLGSEGYKAQTINIGVDPSKISGSNVDLSGMNEEDYAGVEPSATGGAIDLFVLAPAANFKEAGGISLKNVSVVAPDSYPPGFFFLEYDIEMVDPSDNSGSTMTESVSVGLSLDPSTEYYIPKLLPTTPQGNGFLYVKNAFEESAEKLFEEGNKVTIDANLKSDDSLDFENEKYSPARTPYVESQSLGSGVNRKLFRFRTKSDGDAANRDVKVSIQRVQYPSEVAGSDFGSFDVIIRDFDDTDRNRQVLESYVGLNFDPSSDRFLPAVIGDRVQTVGPQGRISVRGRYEGSSEYVVVEMHPEFEADVFSGSSIENIVPWGYGPYYQTVKEIEAPFNIKPRRFQSSEDPELLTPFANIQFVFDAEPPFDDRINFGFDFDFKANLTAIGPVPRGAGAASDSFHLSDAFYYGGGASPDPIVFGDTNVPAEARSFNLAFQGGFDGKDPAKKIARGEDINAENLEGFDLSKPDSGGTEGFLKAFKVLANKDQFDINMLSTPGVLETDHSLVVEAGIRLAQERGDVFYPFDAAGVNDGIAVAGAAPGGYDTNYASAYYPWVYIQDPFNGGLELAPPSLVIPGVLSFNDRQGAEWTAPAGNTRAVIPNATGTSVILTNDDRDFLYENRVNPIQYFFDDGVVVYGQKTLQVRASALDRINVRRLLIRAKKFLTQISKNLLFEQNVPATRNRFLNNANPFFNRIQQENGLYDFRVKMDADNNPAEVIDRNRLVGEIYLQPTRTAEFISLTFNLLPTGAEFPTD